jgi:hypothetical protein
MAGGRTLVPAVIDGVRKKVASDPRAIDALRNKETATGGCFSNRARVFAAGDGLSFRNDDPAPEHAGRGLLANFAGLAQLQRRGEIS